MMYGIFSCVLDSLKYVNLDSPAYSKIFENRNIGTNYFFKEFIPHQTRTH